MFYYQLLNFYMIIKGFFKSKIKLTDVITLKFRTGILNTDINMHLQAGQYFTYTDIGRWDFAVRTGLMGHLLKTKTAIMLGGQKIIYRREIPFFKTFFITMCIAGWDDDFIYAAHVFHRNGKICAVSASKVGLIRKRKRISPKNELLSLGYGSSPEMPGWIQKWFKEDKLNLEHARDTFKM